METDPISETLCCIESLTMEKIHKPSDSVVLHVIVRGLEILIHQTLPPPVYLSLSLSLAIQFITSTLHLHISLIIKIHTYCIYMNLKINVWSAQ
jgi:hypothetical protein